MPDLVKSLEGRDLEGLRIVAELWGVDFDAPDARVGVQRLAACLLDRELVDEVVATLPERASAALSELIRSGARLPWSIFSRRFGGVREMGPGRRDRERPYLNVNASPAEALWYRGMVGRTFFDSPGGPQEFAYIPNDLLAVLLVVLPTPADGELEPLGRPASPAERRQLVLANDSVLDDACTLLAALRSNVALEAVADIMHCGSGSPYPLRPDHLKVLLIAAGLVDAEGKPIPEPTRHFLEADRGEALLFLVNAWRQSADFNELLLLPGLVAEGEWKNDPLLTRQAILEFLGTLSGWGDRTTSVQEYDKQARIADKQGEKSSFWSLESFVAAVHQAYPDYQRPAGDYESWYLRDQVSGEYLNGFQHWDDVDGALLRFFIAGPLHWLGIIDLALPAATEGGEGKPSIVTAFRFSEIGSNLLQGIAPQSLPKDDEKVSIRADGRLRVPVRTARAVRYQLARFGRWQGLKDGFYRYRLTPDSLRSARSAGLRVHHVLTLLNRYAEAVPPNLVKALERWEAHGEEARLERVIVLRLEDPALLAALRKSRAARFLGDALGPAAVMVRTGAVHQVLAALAELGYLGEVNFEEDSY
jgi:hypothetical protein